MRTAQLIQLGVACAVLGTAGCNRAETREQTQRAATDVRTAAARAGDKIADGWLTTRIQAQYFADDQIKARYIDVKSTDGIVTIKGFVETPAAHDRAVQIARSTGGVKQVRDEILIGQSPSAFESPRPVATAGDLPVAGGAAAPDDMALTNSIQAAFFLDPTVKGRRVEVTSQKAVVTLRGEVASEAERSQALLLARNTAGVQRVEDNLTVNASLDQAHTGSLPAAAPVDDATVATDVRAKLAADAQLRTIDAAVTDGVLELRGTVPNAAAHQRALDVARQSTGVAQVIDRLSIARQ